MKSFGEQMAQRLGLHIFMAYPSIDLMGIGTARAPIEKFYRAEDIHALLEQGIVVYETRVSKDRHSTKWFTEMQFDERYDNVNWSTHEGLLIGIKPIQKDTAEKCLADMIKIMDDAGIIEFKGVLPNLPTLSAIKDRAKKLLK